jgi:hypothetical protein
MLGTLNCVRCIRIFPKRNPNNSLTAITSRAYLAFQSQLNSLASDLPDFVAEKINEKIPQKSKYASSFPKTDSFYQRR